MASRLGRRAAALLLLVLVGCRADVVVVERTELDAKTIGDYPAWTPAFRVIGADGAPVRQYQVWIENWDYYRYLEVLEPYDERAELFIYRPERTNVVQRIHPPFWFEVRTYDDEQSRHGFAAVPAPGDTIVVDMRRATHELDYDPDLPEDWPDPGLTVWFRWSTQVAGLDDVEREICCGSFSRGAIQPGRTPLDFAPQARSIESIGLEWSSSEIPGYPGPGAGTLDLGGVSFARQLRTEGLPEPGTTVEIRPSILPIHLKLVRGGQALDAVPFSANFYDDPDDSDDWSVRTTGIADEFPQGLFVFSPRVSFEILGRSGRLEFFPVVLETTVAAGDTLVVDIGAHDLRVRVVDEDGDPVARAEVSIRRMLSWRRVNLFTDIDGWIEHPVNDGYYEVETRLDGLDEAFDEKIVLVREDTEVELTWRR